MAKNMENTSYRKIDVDAYDPENFDENEDVSHIVIQVKPHDVFEREGDDLIAKKTISLNEALFGYEIPLKHLDSRTLILKNKPGDIITPDCIRGIIGEGMPQRRHHDLRGNLYVKFDVAFPNDHFLEDDTKYKMIETAFPPVRKVAYPSNCEEVSLMEYDEKRYRGGRGGGQAYEEDGSDEEMGGHHGPQGLNGVGKREEATRVRKLRWNLDLEGRKKVFCALRFASHLFSPTFSFSSSSHLMKYK
ncbi:unnamed protein product [Cylicocyclus nassatus]|uniref:Chaperone DnaJ C-terminal domain-containing protein n=1 Tax=Cylicocyclus nassatus TaxID=53992 RepID=A0AA36GM26_CYLNA|nr:unnamed protein product [Cylicocyclus nassatus]